jgi:hypothetical protein
MRDGHVLSFGPGDAVGGFDHRVFTLSVSKAGGWRNTLVALHEAAHQGLNDSTAWGHLLRTFAILPGQECTLRELTTRCAQTHESFATLTSVTLLLGIRDAPSMSEIVDAYPAYGSYLDGSMNSRWHRVAFAAALEVCMQSEVLSVTPAEFVPAALSERYSPDARRTVLMRRRGRFFAEVARRAARALGGRWTALSSADGRGSTGGDQRGEWNVVASAGRDAAVAVLADAGQVSMDQARVRAARPALVAAIREIVGPIEIDEDVTNLFDTEHLQLRSPRHAVVRQLGAAPAIGRGHLLAVRAIATVRRQFALREDPWPVHGDAPVAVLRARRGDEVDLYPVVAPDLVAPLRVEGQPLLVNIALSCAGDERWARAWSAAFTADDVVTILLDKPFGRCVDALLADAERLEYTLMPCVEGAALLVLAVPGLPPYLRICSIAAAAGARIRLTREPRVVEVEDPEVFSARHRELAMIGMRIVEDESSVELVS